MTSITSPLRYPGSKRRLAKYIDRVLQENGLYPELFVEPFAGGASVALHLLQNDRVQTIGLVEKDPLVAAFWQTVFSPDHGELDWLIKQVEEAEITLEQWQAFKGLIPSGKLERAWVCLFLNRTSFSGILAPSSGPLGGYAQKSPYPIDCRFPREVLVQRLRQAAALRDRVAFVWEDDWVTGLARIGDHHEKGQLPEDIFFYFDPPFFHKAENLYTHYFANGDHQQLRDAIVGLAAPWILSYDYCDEVDELYQDSAPTHVEALYSAAQNGGSRAVKEVILTNLRRLPADRKLWKATTRRNSDQST
jgi:DNA adenine methylase